MSWKPNNLVQIAAAATDDGKHLTFASATKPTLKYETKNTCGMTWKVNQVLLNGQPIRNWFSTAADSAIGQSVTGHLTFDFAAFNQSSLTDSDRTKVEDAWRNGKQMNVRISFTESNGRDDVVLTFTKV